MNPVVIFSLCTSLFFSIQNSENCEQNPPAQKTYNIVDYGARPDGKTINTVAIQATIDAANKAKGGRVIFPRGKFLSGSIEMKSDVNMYLEEGAVLLGSTNPEDYKAMNTAGVPKK